MAALAGALLTAAVMPRPGLADITVRAPGEGAVLEEATVTLAATDSAVKSGSAEITVNGRSLPTVPIEGGAFSAVITLGPGTNRVSIATPSSRREVTYEYRPGAEGLYRFHPGYLEGDCSECHREPAGKKGPRRQSETCYSCHDSKDEARYLHGPVGAGQCTFCHDPHGSSRQAFLTSTGSELCVNCHDQPSSLKHMETNSSCEKCHNPHGSEKKFFLY